MDKLELKIVRIRAGLTQMELAGKVGINQSDLSHYERGYKVPTKEILDKIKDVCKD